MTAAETKPGMPDCAHCQHGPSCRLGRLAGPWWDQSGFHCESFGGSATSVGEDLRGYGGARGDHRSQAPNTLPEPPMGTYIQRYSGGPWSPMKGGGNR